MTTIRTCPIDFIPRPHVLSGDRIYDHYLTIKEKLSALKGKGGSSC